MIHLINSENKHFYSELLSEMFKNRKRIFIDRLAWNLESDNEQERDEFDTDDTIYLVVINNINGEIRSSLRLNPTKKPHLMSKVFSSYCENGVPTGDKIYEMTRYCYNPNILNPNDRFGAMKQMMCGLMECSILYGWEKITFVVNMPLLAHCLRCGWEINPLGLPQNENGRQYGAFIISVNPEGLAAVRKNAGNTSPLLKILPPNRQVA